MEAKLKVASVDCYNRIYSQRIRKEETLDSVVPDTLPDIGEVLFTGGSLLIRSKDVSAGRVKLEAEVPARVVYRAEDTGSIHCVEVKVPAFLSAESEAIGDGSLCTAEMKLIGLEARVLNPRKVLVRAEVCADVCCYEKDSLEYCEDVEADETIHTRLCCHELSLFSAVTEKTFALTDELPCSESFTPAELLSCRTEAAVDDVKFVGSKLIAKGRVKSNLLCLDTAGEMRRLEHITDFSQIIETGVSPEDGGAAVWVTPSGAYHYISSENGGAVAMEFHLVAQVLCSETKKLCCLDDAYSNTHALELARRELKSEKTASVNVLREKLRQLYELQDVAEVLCCSCFCGSVREGEGKMSLPVTAQCLYRDGEGRCRSEKFSAELSFACSAAEGEKLRVKGVEITECSAAMVPGGIELCIGADMELATVREESCSCICSVTWDETEPLDNSTKPSIVLLRASSSDELWTLARENCSTVEAIVSANHLDEAGESWEKLILIPKTF